MADCIPSTALHHPHIPKRASLPTLRLPNPKRLRIQIESLLCPIQIPELDHIRTARSPVSLDGSRTELDTSDSPSEPSCNRDMFQDPASPTTPPLSPLPHLSAAALGVDKFTKSRAVGQSHRDNEKEHVDFLSRDVAANRTENILLFALFACNYKHARHQRVPYGVRRQVYSHLPTDRAEDHDVHTDEDASRRDMYPLPRASAKLLGQRYISSSFAVVLLELILHRRNMVDSAEPTDTGFRRRRRRSSYRVATSQLIARDVMKLAVKLFSNEHARHGRDIHTYVDSRMGSLAVIIEKWSAAEAQLNPTNVFEEGEEDIEYPPASPTRPEAAEFGSPSRRRGEGAKRCSRCNMVKFTGSGHGRSKCDDGYSISSLIPYRQMPDSPPPE